MYSILPNGEYLINSLNQMQISMDKYKTVELGKALKRVYKNEITIDDAVLLAKNEISKVFNIEKLPIEKDIDMGFYKDVIGICPLCGKEVIRNKYGYGCTGYKDGCTFKINGTICKRIISKSNAQLLLKNGKTSKIIGFVSKNGKTFDAYLKLNNDKIGFEFN